MAVAARVITKVTLQQARQIVADIKQAQKIHSWPSLYFRVVPANPAPYSDQWYGRRMIIQAVPNVKSEELGLYAKGGCPWMSTTWPDG